MYKLRKLSNIPVYVEEDHNDVLEHILRNIGAKYLPLDGNVMVHFDSHPDMLLPHNLKDSDTQDKYLLLDKLSIENWILPATYLGAIDTILWVCPPWANQIRTGSHIIKIGKQITSGNIMVTSTEPYFVSETIVCRPHELENTKDILLLVYRFGEASNQQDVLLRLKDILKEKCTCILDIDLDFFSTKNPFIDMYSKINLYQRLKDIYTFDVPPSDNDMPGTTCNEKLEYAMQSCLKRKQILDKLEDITNHLQEHDEVSSYRGIGMEYIQEFQNIHKEIKSIYGPNEKIDWNIIHNAGCTCDNTELPHHPSSLNEISKLMNDMKTFLSTIFEKKTSVLAHPTIVTIARSSVDDYCPSDQVDFIQDMVEDTLKDLFQCYKQLTIVKGFLKR